MQVDAKHSMVAAVNLMNSFRAGRAIVSLVKRHFNETNGSKSREEPQTLAKRVDRKLVRNVRRQ